MFQKKILEVYRNWSYTLPVFKTILELGRNWTFKLPGFKKNLELDNNWIGMYALGLKKFLEMYNWHFNSQVSKKNFSIAQKLDL